MGGSRYIKLRLLLAVYIIVDMTPTLSVDKARSIDGPNSFVQKLEFKYPKWNKMDIFSSMSHIYFTDSTFQQQKLQTNNYDIINKLNAFISSKAFSRKLSNLYFSYALLIGNLVSFSKHMEHNWERFDDSISDEFLVLFYFVLLVFLLLCKQVKSKDTNLHEKIHVSTNMSNAATTITSMLNIKSEQEIFANFSSDSKTDKYGWIFKFIHSFASRSYFVYPSFQEYDRLASFSEIVHHDDSNDISFVKLANAGFFLMDKKSLVQCQGCGKIKEMKNFNSKSSPSEVTHHELGCRFLRVEDYNEKQKDENNSTSDTQSLESVSSTGNDYLPSPGIASDTSSLILDSVPGATGNTCSSLQETPSSTCFQQKHPEVDSSFLWNDSPQKREGIECHSVPDMEQHGHILGKGLVGEKEEFPSVASGQSGDNSDINATFDDSEWFQPECEDLNQDVQFSRDACKKNPGHFSSFPICNFKLDYIPTKVRHQDVLKFFELLSKITVRIVVGKTSKERAKSFLVENSKKGRIGTGYAVSKPESNYSVQNAVHTGHPGKWRAAKEYLHIARHKDHIYIQTNRHLVYDEIEAQSATVEFYYDNPNRRGIVFAKGISVSHSSILGDLKSVLICNTSDLSLVNMVSYSINEIETLAKHFPRAIKEELIKKVFLIGHPHGGEKKFSFGEYVMIKFEINQSNVNDDAPARIVKINNRAQMPQNSDNVRKVLLYTTDACAGCTGSPVVSFIKTGTGEAEEIILDMWMHNGLDRTNRLNASIMRVLTPEDVANHGHTTIYRPSVQDDMSAEADSAANQVVSCPAYKVLKPPAHPAYAAYVKRLQSYPNPFNHVHTAKDLADCGFFYAGYQDCVRCFHCGLGLKSWIVGDNIHEEHGRNKPDCQFLQLKLREAGIPVLSLQSNSKQNAASSENLMCSDLAILEREQKYLKQILVCKVCLQKPVKDLFLPCGELVACSDCSKILTHCPSCNKRIEATVTTYFS